MNVIDLSFVNVTHIVILFSVKIVNHLFLTCNVCTYNFGDFVNLVEFSFVSRSKVSNLALFAFSYFLASASETSSSNSLSISVEMF